MGVFLSLVLILVGCASGPRTQADLTEIQFADSEKGRGVLDSAPIRPVSILQSVTSNIQSRFTVVVPKSERVTYFVRDARGAVRVLRPERVTRAHSTKAVDHLEVLDLRVGETFELLVVGPERRLWDRRRFRALDLDKRRPRIAVISCMDDHVVEVRDRMWPQLAEQAPDALFLIGDNVYADHAAAGWKTPGPDELWDRYVETREDLPLYRWPDLVPVFATWDDHDYGVNDSDRTFAYKAESLDVFFAFFAQRRPAPGFERGPGVASFLRAWGAEFALLDDRYFRSPNREDVPDQTHFGVEQENWLNARLRTASKPVFLVSGDQFFGGYHPFESYEGSHPKSFARQLTEWKKASVPLLFVSGDRHLSEILKVDALGTYEVTSSGIHSSTFKDAFRKTPSPHQVAGVAGEFNYSILEIMRTEKQRLEVAVSAFGLDKKLLYQKTLTVKRL